MDPSVCHKDSRMWSKWQIHKHTQFV
jgi:hypothetical protein